MVFSTSQNLCDEVLVHGAIKIELHGESMRKKMNNLTEPGTAVAIHK